MTQSSKPGRLKIYLGMAAGVGKTFAMLADAAIEKQRGVDIIAGYIEPHGREATEKLAESFEQIPFRKIIYGEVELKEFDLDAALARHPEIVLVDELAHTNVPGSRHVKRWQDIEEILAAGISVYTTVNIQHIESLRDVVAKLTTVVMQETVPDALVARADEVELVDIPPDDLIQRMKDGKIYAPEKVDQALGNFFKPGHLIALRELVLRYTAERVDAQMRRYRSENAVQTPWSTTGRILVCVGPSPFASSLVRSAKRLATSLHAELIAVCIQNPRFAYLSEAQQELANQALEFAQKLGAEIILQSAQDMVGEVLRIAHEHNVSVIVVGKPMTPGWRRVFSPTLVDEIIRRSSDLSVHVVTSDPGERMKPLPAARKSEFSLQGISATLLVTTLTTIVCELMFPWFDLSNLIMIYLASVAWVASRFGRVEAVCASVASVLAFDFFFVPPHLTLAVSDVQYVLTFLIMMIIGLVISSLTLRIKAHAQVVNDRERRTAALYDLTRQLGGAITPKQIVKIALHHLRALVQRDAAFLLVQDDGSLREDGFSQSRFERDTHERGVIQWVHDRGLEAGSGTDTLPAAKGYYLPLLTPRGAAGVLGIRLDGEGLDPGQHTLLRAFVTQIASAFERLMAEQNSQEAHMLMEQEKLKTSLLSSVSHDLRTPLASIAGAASVIRDQEYLSAGDRRELAGTICEQADRLSRITRNVLDITRFDTGIVELQRDWYALEEIVGSALAHSKALLEPRTVVIEIPESLPLVKVDGVIFEQLFINLLENIARYTPESTNVKIGASVNQDMMTIVVEDDGPGLAVGDELKVFDKLYRGPRSQEGGFGLGLSICRAIAEVHGGTIVCNNRSEGGLRFIVSLPLPDIAPEVTHD